MIPNFKSLGQLLKIFKFGPGVFNNTHRGGVEFEISEFSKKHPKGISLGSCVPNLGNLRPLEVQKKSGELNNRKKREIMIHFWLKTGHFQRAIKSKVF